MFSLQERMAGLGLAALLLVEAPVEAQTTLRYKFKEGEKLDYVIENKMNMKLDVAGKELETNVHHKMDMLWKIESVAGDGKATIHQKMTRIQFAMDLPAGQKIEYDSKDGKLPGGLVGAEAGPVLKALSGLEFTMTMDARGEVRDVKVPAAFLKTLKDSAGFGLEEMFSEEGLKRMMGQSALSFPKEAVAKGKSWSHKLSIKAPFGEMKMDNAYTYEGPVQKGDRKVEHIVLKPSVTLKPDDNVPVAITLKDGGGKGVAYFDNDAGRLLEMTMTQNMTMEAAGQTMRIVQSMVMKLKQ